MADATTTRNRLLGILVALMALACVLLAMLLLQPARTPSASATAAVTTTAGQAAATAPAGQTAAAQATPAPTASDRQISFNDKGFGPVGDLARRTANDPLAKGRADAPVVLVEYSDFACPFCAVWARQQQPVLVQKYVDAGVLRIEYRDLVIFGEKSKRAALAGRAAAAQGRFWQFHDTLFAASPTSGHPDLTDAVLTRFAQQAGVADMARFAKDMNDPALAAAVDKDTQEATRLGARSTPTFVINGVPVVGAQPIDQFTQVIDAAAQVQAKLHP